MDREKERERERQRGERERKRERETDKLQSYRKDEEVAFEIYGRAAETKRSGRYSELTVRNTSERCRN